MEEWPLNSLNSAFLKVYAILSIWDFVSSTTWNIYRFIFTTNSSYTVVNCRKKNPNFLQSIVWGVLEDWKPKHVTTVENKRKKKEDQFSL